MKSLMITTMTALTAILTAPLMAQEAAYGGNTPTPIDRSLGLSTEQRKNMLKKFDRDRNGQIDGKGSVAAKKALRGKKSGRSGGSSRARARRR